MSNSSHQSSDNMPLSRLGAFDRKVMLALGHQLPGRCTRITSTPIAMGRLWIAKSARCRSIFTSSSDEHN